SIVLSAVLSVALGVSTKFTESFDKNGLPVNIITAFIFVSVGLIFSRFLIVVGRRLSKRKSVRYFDSTTLLCMGLSIASGAGFAAIMGSTDATATVGDTAFIGTLVVFMLIFPVASFISLIIGAVKGAQRKSFEDGQ
ncbi:MAG: hypothetical protein ABWZ40_08585, partial [Caulobacterales bacterium]